MRDGLLGVHAVQSIIREARKDRSFEGSYPMVRLVVSSYYESDFRKRFRSHYAARSPYFWNC